MLDGMRDFEVSEHSILPHSFRLCQASRTLDTYVGARGVSGILGVVSSVSNSTELLQAVSSIPVVERCKTNNAGER